MTTINIEKNLLTYRESCRSGTDWLLQRMKPDGSPGPAAERLYYYRVPWALVLMGEVSAASRVLDWVSQNMFSRDGAFEGVSPQGVFESRYGSYPLACLIVGAAMLERHDLVYRGTRSLLTWQDPVSGGFYHDYHERTPTGEQEIFPTSQGGMSLLVGGHRDDARKAGEWLKRLWELQPDVGNRLYAVYSPHVGLVTDYPPDQEALYVTKKDEPWQHHFNGGIAAAFLTKLFLATGEGEWLELARRYQEFSMSTDDCQFQSMQICKSGWGSGMLYLATREEPYLDWTARIGDWFVDNQLDDGHWENTKFFNPDPTLADNIETTAEFVMHVANIVASISVKP